MYNPSRDKHEVEQTPFEFIDLQRCWELGEIPSTAGVEANYNGVTGGYVHRAEDDIFGSIRQCNQFGIGMPQSTNNVETE